MSVAGFAQKTADAAGARSAVAVPSVRGELRIGEADTIYEQEADRIADEVITGGAVKRHWSLSSLTSGAALQRTCACGGSGDSDGECEACKQKKSLTLQRKATGAVDPGVAPAVVRDVLTAPGQPLDWPTRAFFEPRFGQDLSAVRIHSDRTAAESARQVGARAYTVGPHVAFADGEFAPWTSAGRTLLAHELVHVAQQAGAAPGSVPIAPAPVHLARAEAPYVSPYTDALAQELFDRLLQQRIRLGGTAYQQSQRVGAVAVVFDRQGNRLGEPIERMNVPKGAHAEDLVKKEIQIRMAAGEPIEYTVLMVDQDPCPGLCTPMLKEWIGNPQSGTTRVVTPAAMNKLNPAVPVSGKTAYQRALTQDTIPFEPKTLPASGTAGLKTRGDLTRVRLPLYKEPNPPPSTNAPSNLPADVTADVSGDAAAAAAKTVDRTEANAAQQALEDAAAAQLAKRTAQTAEKDVAETAAQALTTTATSQAARRLGQASAPLIGAAFAAPDAWRGLQDLTHGDVVLGLGTIGVAIVDVASQGLHLTDEITAGGGTILAITIQTWAATMQFGFEMARVKQRASELKAYMKAHGNRLPPRDELMSYYGLNDEDILILENDIYKAGQNKVTTEDLAKQVRALLAQIDADANKPLPEGVTPEGLQKERASLGKLLVALEADVEQKRAQAAKDRAAADEKRRQQNFDRAQQQTQQAQTRAQTAPALLPTPDVSQQRQQPPANDPFHLLSPGNTQPLNGISMENAELAGTSAGRRRAALIARYDQLATEHFPSDKVRSYQDDVTAYVNGLDQLIAAFKKDGSLEWPGVKELRRLRDAADNDDRSKLMR